jgi:nitrogen PTS system EIIA component
MVLLFCVVAFSFAALAVRGMWRRPLALAETARAAFPHEGHSRVGARAYSFALSGSTEQPILSPPAASRRQGSEYVHVTDILPESLVIPALTGRNKEEILREVAGHLAAQHPEIDADRLVEVLWERERLGSTAIGDGIAIPHCKLPGVTTLLAAFGRHVHGVDFQSLDGNPTTLFFLLVAPEDSVGLHLKALARMSWLLKNQSFREQLMGASDRGDLYGTIHREDEKY